MEQRPSLFGAVGAGAVCGTDADFGPNVLLESADLGRERESLRVESHGDLEHGFAQPVRLGRQMGRHGDPHQRYARRAKPDVAEDFFGEQNGCPRNGLHLRTGVL